MQEGLEQQVFPKPPPDRKRCGIIGRRVGDDRAVLTGQHGHNRLRHVTQVDAAFRQIEPAGKVVRRQRPPERFLLVFRAAAVFQAEPHEQIAQDVPGGFVFKAPEMVGPGKLTGDGSH